jgi:hypothetical protein
MRKLLSAFLCVVFMAGIVVAAEVTLVKFDAKTKEITVKDADGKEATYKITDKTKFSTVTKDETKEGKYEDFEKRLSSDKAAGKMKMDLTTDKDTVTEFKVKGGKKGKN